MATTDARSDLPALHAEVGAISSRGVGKNGQFVNQVPVVPYHVSAWDQLHVPYANGPVRSIKSHKQVGQRSIAIEDDNSATRDIKRKLSGGGSADVTAHRRRRGHHMSKPCFGSHQYCTPA